MKSSRFALMLIPMLLLGLLPGCYFNGTHYVRYDNSADYAAGDFTYAAADVTEVVLHWVDGSIVLAESDKAELSAGESGSGSLSKKQQMQHRLNDGVLEIYYCASGYRGDIHAKDKDLLLELPAGVPLTVESVSAPIEAAVLTSSRLTVNSVSGDVEIERLESSGTAIDTVSGEIELDFAVAGEGLTLLSVSGDISVEQLSTEQLSAETVSGKLDIEITACREAKLSTVSGASEIKLPADGGTIRFTTTSGSLETQRAFQQQENFYGFGPGDCRIIVESVSGNLRVA